MNIMLYDYVLHKYKKIIPQGMANEIAEMTPGLLDPFEIGNVSSRWTSPSETFASIAWSLTSPFMISDDCQELPAPVGSSATFFTKLLG
jgi:hypothetical protein